MDLHNGKLTLGMQSENCLQFSRHSCSFKYVITMTDVRGRERYMYIMCLGFRISSEAFLTIFC